MQIVITTTQLIITNHPVNLVNWQFFGINFAMLNKIRRVFFWDSNILKLLLENRSFHYGDIPSVTLLLLPAHTYTALNCTCKVRASSVWDTATDTDTAVGLLGRVWSSTKHQPPQSDRHGSHIVKLPKSNMSTSYTLQHISRNATRKSHENAIINCRNRIQALFSVVRWHIKSVGIYIYTQEAQLMLTTGSTRLAVSRGQQTLYHSTCYI